MKYRSTRIRVLSSIGNSALVLVATGLVLNPLAAFAQKRLVERPSTTATAPLRVEDSKAIARAQGLLDELRSGSIDRRQLTAKLNAEIKPSALEEVIAQVRGLGRVAAWTLSKKTNTTRTTAYTFRIALTSGDSRSMAISIDADGKISDFSLGAYDETLYIHPQHLVDVGGRRMNIYCAGTGSPAVILDAGLGDTTAVWSRVQGPIARHTRVCSYDRAGMGFSDPTTTARDAVAIVGDLHALLRRAAIAPPYVIVGHSLAGLYTRLYADRYPHDVVGLVLIDPVTEYDDALYQKIAPARSRLRDVLRKCATNVAKCPLGTTAQIRKTLIADGCPQAAPADCAVSEVVAEEHGRQSFWKDEFLEVLAEPTSAAQVRAGQRPYGSLPLVVLSAGHPDTEPGPMTTAQQRAIWIAQGRLHGRIAALSSRGVKLAVGGSGHSIQIDRPSAVISAINGVVDQARHRSGK
jgi:pimeloyl-ACP methyl ester carboxylesterase